MCGCSLRQLFAGIVITGILFGVYMFSGIEAQRKLDSLESEVLSHSRREKVVEERQQALQARMLGLESTILTRIHTLETELKQQKVELQSVHKLAKSQQDSFEQQAPAAIESGDGGGKNSQEAEAPLLSSSLVPPPVNKSYKFRKYDPESGKSASQFKQSEDVDNLLRKMEGGFVVESGALDGESHSNSVFFEVRRKWDCLLVEANPPLQQRILSLNRRCHLLKGGLSITKNISSFKFILGQAVGGIVDTMSKDTIDEIEKKIKSGKMAGEASTGKIIDVPCFPLHQVIRALGRTVVDYWSLDTEGSEAKILAATDFSAIEVGVITVEHQGNINRRKGIYNTLTRQGFIRGKAGMPDDLYLNKKYCAKRGITLPDAVLI